MAVNSTFYINAADFETATAVYLDLALTYIAPDGYYRVGTVVRQQSGGILLAVDTCGSCPTPCDVVINATGGYGIYQINLDTGISTGAIRIRFSPLGIPDGIRVTYDGIVYNKLSSSVYGVIQSANYGHYTIAGSTGSTSSCSSWYPLGGTLTQDVYLYDSSTNTFLPTVPPSTQINTVETDDFFLFGANVGVCWIVIPKTTTAPSNVLIEVIGPCSLTQWDIRTFCPVALPTFSSSDMFPSPPSCIREIINTYYFSNVNTISSTLVGLYDYVFTDANGEFPLVDGFYLTNSAGGPGYKVLEVVNGVVVAITNCI